MIKAIIIFSSILLMSACVGQKQPTYTAIQFGAGGGFTGAVQRFELKDGMISAITDDQSNSLIKSLSKEEMKLISRLLDQLKDVSYDVPANMYQFIEVTQGDELHQFQWNISAQRVPKELIALHSKLMEHVNNN